MKVFISVFLVFTAFYSFSQNRTLRGKVYYLNSSYTPAAGVKISGSVNGEHANPFYTTSNGQFELVFPISRVGSPVEIEVGDIDAMGEEIEVINSPELKNLRFPANHNDTINPIIIAPKGKVHKIALKYYQIFKVSQLDIQDNAIAELKKLDSDGLANSDKARELSKLIDDSKKAMDSLQLYKEAYKTASINKDNASKRLLDYLNALDEGQNLSIAREKLSIEKASKEARVGIGKYKIATEELEQRISASRNLFDFEDAITTLDTLMILQKEIGINRHEISHTYRLGGRILAMDGKYIKSLDYMLNALSELGAPSSREDSLEVAILNRSIAKAYYLTTDYDNAISSHEKALEIFEKILGEMDPELGASFNQLGTVYLAKGYPSTALEFQENAKNIFENNKNQHSRELGVFYNDLGNTYNALSEFDLAIVFFEKAISIFKKDLVPNDPELATSYNNISWSYELSDKYNKAKLAQKESIKIREAILNTKHPALAGNYSNLGNIYNRLKKNDSALIYHKKAILIEEEIYDSMHPNLAFSYNNIANVYLSIRQDSIALSYLEKALKIRKQVLDSLHPDLGESYLNIGTFYSRTGKYSEALDYQKDALVILEARLNPNNRRIGMANWNLGVTYEKLEDFQEAVNHLFKAEIIFKNCLPVNHNYHSRVLINRLDVVLKKLEKAYQEENYDLVLKEFEVLKSKRNVDGLWYLVGESQYFLGNYSEAIISFKIYEELYPTSKQDEIYSILGRAYVKNQEYPKAEEAFLKFEGLFPNRGEVYLNWSYYFACQKQYDKALENFKKSSDMGNLEIKWFLTDKNIKNFTKRRKFREILEK